MQKQTRSNKVFVTTCYMVSLLLAGTAIDLAVEVATGSPFVAKLVSSAFMTIVLGHWLFGRRESTV